jgi:hypothetical protein
MIIGAASYLTFLPSKLTLTPYSRGLRAMQSAVSGAFASPLCIGDGISEGYCEELDRNEIKTSPNIYFFESWRRSHRTQYLLNSASQRTRVDVR